MNNTITSSILFKSILLGLMGAANISFGMEQQLQFYTQSKKNNGNRVFKITKNGECDVFENYISSPVTNATMLSKALNNTAQYVKDSGGAPAFVCDSTNPIHITACLDRISNDVLYKLENIQDKDSHLFIRDQYNAHHLHLIKPFHCGELTTDKSGKSYIIKYKIDDQKNREVIAYPEQLVYTKDQGKILGFTIDDTSYIITNGHEDFSAIKDDVLDKIDALLEKGESLEELTKKSEDLSFTSKALKPIKKPTTVNDRNKKPFYIIGGISLLAFVVLAYQYNKLPNFLMHLFDNLLPKRIAH